VQRRGFTVWQVGWTMAEAFAPRHVAVPAPPSAHRFVVAGTAVFVPAAEGSPPTPRAQAWRPDVVVSEVLELAGLVVAARTDAPVLAGLLPPVGRPGVAPPRAEPAGGSRCASQARCGWTPEGRGRRA
jgi:hypothetical protein